MTVALPVMGSEIERAARYGGAPFLFGYAADWTPSALRGRPRGRRAGGRGFGATGRELIQHSISSSPQVRVFGPVRWPGGKLWSRIQFFNVTRLGTMPRSCKSRKRTRLFIEIAPGCEHRETIHPVKTGCTISAAVSYTILWKEVAVLFTCDFKPAALFACELNWPPRTQGFCLSQNIARGLHSLLSAVQDTRFCNLG